MTQTFNRRGVLAGLSAAGAISLSKPAIAKNRPKVVIIGGGFGGASAAMHLRKIAPSIEVTLIEPGNGYSSCPMSNLMIAGHLSYPALEFGYIGLRSAGINLIRDWATHIDADKKRVKLANGSDVTFDRLIVSPGIDFHWNAIEGYDEAAAEIMPHAWKGFEQALRLQHGLSDWRDNGTLIIAIPPPPFRCPPGPYERASLLAELSMAPHFRRKILILDAQDKFAKQSLFEKYWNSETAYAGIIERIPGSESGQVMRVDPGTKTVFTEFDEFKGDVVNIIPPQWAGKVARENGLTDPSGWCPINGLTFESTLVPHVHIIGDACIASPMPKSAFSANQQAKVCAHQIVRSLNDQAPTPTKLLNTCYSHIFKNSAVSVTGVYENSSGVLKSVPGAGGTTPLDHTMDRATLEARYALDWFNTITKEAFG